MHASQALYPWAIFPAPDIFLNINKAYHLKGNNLHYQHFQAKKKNLNSPLWT